MNIRFRYVSSRNQYDKVIDFLEDDVRRSGGSAGEVVNVNGILQLILVCRFEWPKLNVSGQATDPLIGTYESVLITEDMDRLSALAWMMTE